MRTCATNDGHVTSVSTGITPRTVPLRDGGILTVRPVCPADVSGLSALYDGLSDDDRYRRFFSSYRPPESFFERISTVIDRGGYGVVATVRSCDAEQIVAEANYELLLNGDGELAMTVAAEWRGWLGAYLLDALVEGAAARGVPNLEAAVLVINRSMLAVLRSRGYASVGANDWSSLRLVIGTRGRTPVWPPGPGGGSHESRPRVLVEAPGGRWHAADEAAAAGLRVMVCSGPRGARPRCPALAGKTCPLAADADAIVISNAPDDEQWRALVDAHASLHPGVPVCVEPRRSHGRAGAPALGRDVSGAARVIEDDDPLLVVDLVDRLASVHRSNSTP
jgi:hypothetical protein